jgi:hypothetical protein
VYVASGVFSDVYKLEVDKTPISEEAAKRHYVSMAYFSVEKLSKWFFWLILR